MKARKPSLPLQILLYCHNWYTLLWLAINLILLIWKYQNFLYTRSTFRWECSIIVFQTIVDLIRVELATRGNKTSEGRVLCWSFGLSIPVIVGYSFYLRLQSYVLHIDVIINSIGIAFVTSEVMLKLIDIVRIFTM